MKTPAEKAPAVAKKQPGAIPPAKISDAAKEKKEKEASDAAVTARVAKLIEALQNKDSDDWWKAGGPNEDL